MVAASDPSASDAAFPADAIEVARVLDAWGIKGWIRVQPYAKDPQALFSSRRWFLRPPEARPGRAAREATATLPTLLRIAEAREHGDDVVASLGVWVHTVDVDTTTVEVTDSIERFT